MNIEFGKPIPEDQVPNQRLKGGAGARRRRIRELKDFPGQWLPIDRAGTKASGIGLPNSMFISLLPLL